MIYTVTFNPAIDYIVHTDEMETGGVIRSSREEIYIGGKGLNVSQVLKDGYRTVDIMSEGMTKVGCKEMGTLIAERI